VGATKSTTWTIEAHTRAKHEILRRYLQAWTAILGQGGFPRIAYVDGFAGPGTYADGEDGSPIIALNAALAQRAVVRSEVRFLFIEEDASRAKMLDERVSAITLPGNFHARVVGGAKFEEAFRKHFVDAYAHASQPWPATFAFVDPFGWTGVPFTLIREILAQRSCEVLVNFMFEEVNRFIAHPDQAKNFDVLFGTSDWRQMSGIQGKTARRDFLHGLYLRQLRVAAKYVRSFEMRNDNDVTDYYLFFATNSRQGMIKMKEAMWKIDQSGEFRFSDATNPDQALLFSPKPDFASLRTAILTKFSGQEATVAEIEDFVLADTPFRETHYKREVLALLEHEGRVTPINPPARRRGGTYAAPAMKLRFAASAP